MNNESVNPPPEPPLPGSENEQRRETMLAYYLGALEPDQEALIRGRIETSPEWQSARLEAKTMLAGLKRDGPAAETAPSTLAERTLAKLRDDGKPNEKTAATATATVRRPTSKPRLAPTPRSLQSTRRVFAAVFAICLSVLGVLALRNSWRSDSSPAIYWRTDSTLAAGGPFAPMLQIRDAASGAPAAANVAVTLVDARTTLNAKEIGTASTDETGTVAAPNWRVPAVPAGDYILRVQARSAMGSVIDSAEQAVKVVASNRLALAPDRTQARPGETIRVRALAVSNLGQMPVRNSGVRFDILDPSGNRINRIETHTSNFGLAWAEFPLDTAAPEGAYKLTAVSEGLTAERTVTVKQYTMPAFQVAIAPAKAWFKKSETITGSIDAHTYDGQRIADARCELTLMDATGRVLGQQRLEPSADGRAEFKLPWSSVDEGERTALVLQAKVTDGGGRTVESNRAIPVASGALLLSAIAEAQELVPGVANRVYVLARDPEGRGVKSHLIIHRGVSAQEVDTDDAGVAMITLENPELPAEVLEVVDRATGVARRVTLPIRAENNGRLLVRTDRAIVQGGQTLNVTLLCGAATPPVNGVALLALRKDGATIASRGVKLSGAATETQLDIPVGSTGLYSLETSLQIAPGDVWADRRAVLVASSSGVKVVASADRPEYKPGQRARLNFQVSDATGKSVPAAVSVLAVDEALLTLTGDNPGLAQALLSDESGTLMQPDLPLNVREFGPAQGESPAALAALAKATPAPVAPNAAFAKLDKMERNEEISRSDAEIARAILRSTSPDKRSSLLHQLRSRGYGSEFDDVLSSLTANDAQIIDRSAAKLNAAQVERLHWNSELMQLIAALLAIGVTFFLTQLFLTHVTRSTPRKIEVTSSFVASLTALVLVQALVILAFIPMASTGLFLACAGIGLIASHFVLMYYGTQGASNDAMVKLIAITLLSDLYLMGAAYLALQGSRGDPSLVAFALLGAMPVLFAQFAQTMSITWMRVGIAFAGLFIFFTLFVGTRGSFSPLGEMKNAERMEDRPVTSTAYAAPTMTATGLSTTPVSAESANIVSNSPASTPARPHLRWDFPEAMIFAPEIITDENGNASFELNVSDSLTRWRVQTDAVAGSGGVAQTQSSLIVTQPFSVDLILPASVTAGDVLHVPAVVSNHTKTEQRVDVKLELTGAFKAGADGLSHSLTVGPDASAATEFIVRFATPGTARLRVSALPAGLAAADADAIERTLTVIPDGQAVAFTSSSLIAEKGSFAIQVPDGAIPGTIRAALTVHRGPLTQMIEGLDAMLQEPHGCFEQTSSSTYPNIMILRYLKAHEVNQPVVLDRAKHFIEMGYQRLLSFEVNGHSGSFSLFGQAPASTWLTAYGLQEFNDMAAVFPVDPALLERMRAYLIGRMRIDGSFDVDDYHGHDSAERGLAATAYVVQALGAAAPETSIRYLNNHREEIERDPYLCALCANALLRADHAWASQFAAQLPRLAQVDAESGTATLPGKTTLAWGYGDTASIESSALGALALLQTGQYVDTAQKLLAGVQSRCNNFGGWGSTHATVLAMKALECAAGRSVNDKQMRVVVEVNGEALPVIELKAEETALPVSIPLTLPKGKSTVRVQVSGGALVARVSGTAWVPWTDAATAPGPVLRVTTGYDATTVTKNHAVLGTLKLSANGRRAEVPMVEWGMAAGFQPESADLDALKQRGTITRWELSGRSLHLYLPNLDAGKDATLSVRFTPTASGSLSAQPGRAYEYYSAADAVAIKPVKFEVK